jgi:hypothetical protein
MIELYKNDLILILVNEILKYNGEKRKAITYQY